MKYFNFVGTGPVVQSVACPIADLGVGRMIPARLGFIISWRLI